VYSTRPNLVLGFHGCDRSVAEAVVCGRERLQPSENDYDWLGHGVYFWENNPDRALEYALYRREHPLEGAARIADPFILGAVLGLGHSLDLLESGSLALVSAAYDALSEAAGEIGAPLPQNKGGHDIRVRCLDCAVIEALHEMIRGSGEPGFDSVRGVFTEGEELYPNAGFHRKDHIQICLRNPNCIKGYFLPLVQDDGYPLV